MRGVYLCVSERVHVYDYLTKMQLCEAKFTMPGTSLLWCPQSVGCLYVCRAVTPRRLHVMRQCLKYKLTRCRLFMVYRRT